MASLIQQRMALDRLRTKALWAIWCGVAGTVIGLLLLVTHPSGRWTSWLAGAVWLVLLVYGLLWMRRYRHAVREFEADHGVGAGEQS